MNPADDNEFLPAIMPNCASLGGIREAAGVMTTHAMLDRFPTTDTNRNRHRVSEMSKRFVGCVYPVAGITAAGGRVIQNHGDGQPWLRCVPRHHGSDGGAFQNWAPDNRFRPNGAGAAAHDLPNFYKSTNYMNDAKGNEYYQMGDKWFRDVRPQAMAARRCQTPTTIRRQRSGWAPSSRPIPLRDRCGGLLVQGLVPS